jgi:alkanesulfonate monooxygenase SsuD/methylene tetrahydromethanopterin reductase-like flavin-dependent oxidoreductase (luciferase family)
MNNTHFGLLMPAARAQLAAGSDARDLLDIARTAERVGFDSVWMGDSLARARIEPLTLLTAVAQVTERVIVGTASLIPAYRHPAQAALTIASLDLLSGGRVVLGVGAGFPGLSEPEFDLVGVPFRTRFSHLDDTVALWRQLWSGGPTSFHGKVLHYDWLPEVPTPHQAGGPPIWLAGATPAALARTGRLYDGWLPYPPDPKDYGQGLATIRTAAEESGRAADALTPALFATVYVDDDAERGRAALDDYCLATYGRPFDWVGKIQVMVTGSREKVAAQLNRYVEAGARHIVIRIAAIDPGTFAAQLAVVEQLLR